MVERPDWDTYFINLLPHIASRSTCIRRKIGAVIVKDNRILGTGYNGPPSGLPHCATCRKDSKGYDSGTNQLDCYASHAELNAICHCAAHGVSVKGATIYCSVSPCSYCTKAILQAGLLRVVYEKEYPDALSLDMLLKRNIEVLLKPNNFNEEDSMVVHFDTGKFFMMPISGRHTVCACGRTFQDSVIKYAERHTEDKDKVTCKICLRNLSKDKT